jgi:hypothetical protein
MMKPTIYEVMKKAKHPGIILCICLAILPSAAVQAADPATVMAPDMTIGWARLDVTNIDPSLSHIGVLIPRSLMKGTSFINERYRSLDEMPVKAIDGKAPDIAIARKAVVEARRKRDQAALTVRDVYKRINDIRKAQEELDKANSRLETLLGSAANTTAEEQPPDENIPSPRISRLKNWKGHAEDRLLEVSESAAALCKAEGLDLLVHGKLTMTGPFLIVDIMVFSALAGDIVWQGSEYAGLDDFEQVVPAMSRALARAIAGREFARVQFTVMPAAAVIEVEGTTLFGTEQVFFDSRIFTAFFHASGYSSLSKRHAVSLGRDDMIAVTLSPIMAGGVQIRSNPPGAAIYLDGVRLGNAPLSIPGPSRTAVLMGRLAGYDDTRLILRSGMALSEQIVEMQPTEARPFEERFESAKSSFYRSLGWFILSLPSTVLSYGVLNSYLQSSQSGAQGPTFAIGYWASGITFWISTAANLLLAGNAGFSLAAYLKAIR